MLKTRRDFLIDQQKLDFLGSCAGPELAEKEARVRFSAVGQNEAHSYDKVLKETKTALLKFVSKDRALIELLHIEQGTRNCMDFLSEIKDQECLCRIEEQPITGNDMKRISLIADMRDRTLAEKALEDCSLTDVIKAGITREAFKATVDDNPFTEVKSGCDETATKRQIQQEVQNI